MRIVVIYRCNKEIAAKGKAKMLRLKDRRGKLTPIRSESDRWKQQVNERQDGIGNDDRPLSFSATVGGVSGVGNRAIAVAAAHRKRQIKSKTFLKNFIKTY